MRPTFDDMPYEIILAIAKALNSAPMVARLASTCQRCRDLFSDQSLWKDFCLSRFGPPLHEGLVDAGKDWRWVYRAQARVAAPEGPDVGAVMTPGRIYWGDTLDGRPHGYGLSLSLPTLHRDGSLLTRRSHDVGLAPTTPRHDGYWSHGREHGYGVRVYRNGSHYRGAWRDGVHHGHGERFDVRGWHYEGQWHDGHCHDDVGSGRCTAALDCVYIEHAVGAYSVWRYPAADLGPLRNRATQRASVDPCADGQDRLTSHTGVVYTRARVDGTMKGTITWPDGRRFEGRWTGWQLGSADLIDGVLTCPDGTVREGTFFNGRLWGQGTLQRPDGVRIECHWQRGYGSVAVTWPDGRRYQGAWNGEACHGSGEMTYPDGSRYVGTWRDGRRHEGTAICQGNCNGCMACLDASPA